LDRNSKYQLIESNYDHCGIPKQHDDDLKGVKITSEVIISKALRLGPLKYGGNPEFISDEGSTNYLSSLPSF
jgi:hypothetical protein